MAIANMILRSNTQMTTVSFLAVPQFVERGIKLLP